MYITYLFSLQVYVLNDRPMRWYGGEGGMGVGGVGALQCSTAGDGKHGKLRLRLRGFGRAFGACRLWVRLHAIVL